MPQGNPAGYLNASQFGQGGALTLPPQSPAQVSGTLAPLLSQSLRGQRVQSQNEGRNEDRFVNEQFIEGDIFGDLFGGDSGVSGGDAGGGDVLSSLAQIMLPGGSLLAPIQTAMDYQQAQGIAGHIPGGFNPGFSGVLSSLANNTPLGLLGIGQQMSTAARTQEEANSTRQQATAQATVRRVREDSDRAGGTRGQANSRARDEIERQNRERGTGSRAGLSGR